MIGSMMIMSFPVWLHMQTVEKIVGHCLGEIRFEPSKLSQAKLCVVKVTERWQQRRKKFIKINQPKKTQRM